MEAVAEMNIPRLHQLVSVGLRRGSSPSVIIRMMQSALEGVYRPRPILDWRTLDIALMVYRLGGRKLLYAVNQGLGLPSLRTLRNHMAFTKIMPTVGTISFEDILHNIREVVLKPRASAAIQQPLRGCILQIDEVALEEAACHFRHNNSVGGLCWRHSPVGLQLRSYDDALNIAAKIKAGTVHLGKEMTVVSVSCFGESGTYPILALPTCKFVGPEESSTIYETVTEAWIEHASKTVGMPWSWATDGDGSRRKAGYSGFTRTRLPRASPIFSTVAGMAGLNIFTGIHSITLDFDYKHVFKRICTLIRSAGGMALNNGRIINPAVLTRFPARLPDQSNDSVCKLLFPDDPQDVPRAVELMNAIIDLLECDFGQVDADTAADLDLFPNVIDSHLMVYVGQPALICQDETQQLIQQHDNKVQRVCGNWRAHISTHILRCIRIVTQVLRVPVCPFLKSVSVFKPSADWSKPSLRFLRFLGST
ncbi:hypothetical protein C8R43DRAFT_885956 [Mycena crocata]|nr:hypothetical protein C8R43DRAFT_885956 [Mycena crocata]